MKRTVPLLAAVAAVSLALAGCAPPSAPVDGSLSIVASTSVYGDIASSIVGDLGTMTSIISDSGVDPHSFEASARDQLAIADADVVIANGGGYDPFVDALLEASGSKAVVIDAVTSSGLLSQDQTGVFNEHVWYSLNGMTQVIGDIAEELGKIDPTNSASFEANSATLIAELRMLETRETELAALFTGGGVAVTEPVPVYLLEAIGLENLTPGDFSEAIEEGNDVPPLALEETLDLLTNGSVRVLAYNSQTASPETERVRQAAEAAGIPVVEFTETLPEGAGYVSWMSDNLDALSAALQPR